MTDEGLRRLRDRVYEATGNHFDDDTLYVLKRRLEPRLRALALRTFDAYCDRLDRGELEEIADRVTTNETYFFREADQLDVFARAILPRLARDRSRRLSIWSAGCSTGEEAYSIAIIVLESGLFAGWDVRIFGSDLSRRVVKIARAAEYGEAAFRATDARRRARWFEPVGGRHRVHADVRALCRFGHINLVDADEASVLGEFDVVLCRNVLIYFDAASRRRALAIVDRKLSPGGYLLLGHAEAGLAVDYERVRDLVHRKADR